MSVYKPEDTSDNEHNKTKTIKFCSIKEYVTVEKHICTDFLKRFLCPVIQSLHSVCILCVLQLERTSRSRQIFLTFKNEFDFNTLLFYLGFTPPSILFNY